MDESGATPKEREREREAIRAEGREGTPDGPHAGSRDISREWTRDGTLYLVATPIGNLGDLSSRAREVLGQVDAILAEDTRRTRALLHAMGLRKPLLSYHAHSSGDRTAEALVRLKEGRRLALVSDAGTPAISDPGQELVAACAREDIPVSIVPGPCAAIAALAVSGLDTSRFVFEGFLPRAGRNRRDRLAVLAREERTWVLHEAPHRLERLLADLSAAGLGDRRLALCRELTKRYEEISRMTVDQAVRHLGEIPARGEYVLVLEGTESHRTRMGIRDSGAAGAAGRAHDPLAHGDDEAARDPEALLRDGLLRGLSVREAARETADRTGRNRRDLYALAVRIRQGI